MGPCYDGVLEQLHSTSTIIKKKIKKHQTWHVKYASVIVTDKFFDKVLLGTL